MSARHIAPWVLALCLAPVSGAQARNAANSPLLWATVNVCDTADHPDTIGLRASMPSLGPGDQTMYMRFRIQYQRADGTWRTLGSSRDSGFVVVGRGRRTRQAGRSFRVNPPRAGRIYTLRGVVAYEWRKSRRVVTRASRYTTGGHRSTAGADPAGFSAGSCTISA